LYAVLFVASVTIVRLMRSVSYELLRACSLQDRYSALVVRSPSVLKVRRCFLFCSGGARR